MKHLGQTVALLAWSVICSGAVAQTTRSLQAAIPSNWDGAELSAEPADGTGALTVEQGARILLRARASERMHLAVLLQNPEGQFRVMVPSRPDTGDLLIPGMDMMLPDTVNGEVLFADMNPGRAAVYLVGTEKPAFAGQEISRGDPSPWVSSDEIVRRLEDAESGARAITRIPMAVRAPSVKEFVSADEFVEFYTVGTRSVKNADRGFRIGFKLNSADLDEFSRRQLESVGAGMKDQRLAAQRFLIEGHTDDLGAPDYNRELSVRRAQAVRDYLARVSGVPRQRLDIRGLGQSKPQVEGSTEQARSQNRRVVIRRLDGG